MLVLREAFCRNRICTQEGIQILNGATVPIIKLTDRKTDVKVDMSFNMNNGLRSAQLILVCIKKIKLCYVIILFFSKKI
jgi:non-canonical poly(A) RNA polymerase PAPD5/7